MNDSRPAVLTGLFILFLVLYVRTQCNEVYVADSGELTATAYVLGVPHPTGYPLYSILARSFQLFIPLGNLASRTALLSVLSGVLTVVLIYIVVTRLFNMPSGLAASLVYGLSTTFWSQTTIQEIYAIHIFLLMWQLDLAFRISAEFTRKRWFLFLFVTGLAVSNHLLSILALPALVGLLYRRLIFRELTAIEIIRGIPFLLMGWSVQMMLPLRSVVDCPMRWVPVHSFNRLVYHITGRQFQPIMFGTPWNELKINFFHFCSFFEGQWGHWFLALVFLGWILGLIRRFRLTVVLLFYFIFPVLFAVNYRIVDIEVYYLQSYLAAAIGFGILFFFSGRLFGAKPRHLLTASALSVTLVVLFLGLLVRNYAACDRSDHRIGYEFGIDVFNSLPLDAILVTQGWSSPFVLSYLEYALHYRPDVKIVIDYKGLHFIRAVKESWDIPLYTTVPMEIPGLEDRSHIPEGLAYRFETEWRPVSDREVDWDCMRLSKTDWTGQILDLHGRALAAKYHYMHGEWLYRKGLQAEALKELLTAENIGRGNNMVLSNLSAIYFRMDNHLEAERLARKSIALNGRFYQAHHNLGNALMKQGKYVQAIREFQLGKDQMIAMGRTHQALGYSYLRSGETEKAIEEFQQALRYSPGSIEIRVNLSSALLEKDRLLEADIILEQLVLDMPERADVLNNLGVLWMKRSDFDRALEYFREAASRDPQCRDAWINMAVLLAERGDFDQAERIFENLEAAGSESIRFLNNYALLFHKTRRYFRAIEYWRKSLIIQPVQPSLIESLRCIERYEEALAPFLNGAIPKVKKPGDVSMP
ncbi:DUF2723 domain-containing protein [bacterium]|nr:DUF2723 domain-containing protein [candidate division CSSED10-310 bacterium]